MQHDDSWQQETPSPSWRLLFRHWVSTDKVPNNSVFPPNWGEREDCQGLVGRVTIGERHSTVTAGVLHWWNCLLVASWVPSHALLTHFHNKIRGRFGCIPHNVGAGEFATCRKARDIASAASRLSTVHYLLTSIPFALSSHPSCPQKVTLDRLAWHGAATTNL